MPRNYYAAPTPRSWMAWAACIGADTETFFRIERTARARSICLGCLVRARCQAWNDEAEGRTTDVAAIAGVYAGETPSERVARRKVGA